MDGISLGVLLEYMYMFMSMSICMCERESILSWLSQGGSECYVYGSGREWERKRKREKGREEEKKKKRGRPKTFYNGGNKLYTGTDR